MFISALILVILRHRGGGWCVARGRRTHPPGPPYPQKNSFFIPIPIPGLAGPSSKGNFTVYDAQPGLSPARPREMVTYGLTGLRVTGLRAYGLAPYGLTGLRADALRAYGLTG